MSLSWIRVDLDVVDHPKTHDLCGRVGDPLAGWYVLRLWTWVMRYAPGGTLDVLRDVPWDVRGTSASNVAEASIERACGWRGEPGALVAALVAAGWLERDENGVLSVHDWAEKQGAAVEKARKDAERKKKARNTRRGDVQRTKRGRPTDSPRDGAAAARVRDETRRDETKEEGAPVPGAQSRESDQLCEIYRSVVGSTYVWQGAKDGAALAKLRKVVPLSEVLARWRIGLSASTDDWASCRTVAQLCSKWNDLAPGKPVRVNPEHKPSRLL